ncbi:MAG: hypothetical protein IPM54_39795 [Polyangiaceae bacterium]|nr:hypothetical protein [Polyangiaceae bacterium]
MRFFDSLLLAGPLVLMTLAGCSRSRSDASPTAASAAPSASAASAGATADAMVGHPPDVDVTAADVLGAYETDAKAASARYRGKVALVYGPMGEVGNDDAKGAFVTFLKNADDPAPNAAALRCYLKAGEEAALGSRNRGDKMDAVGVIDEADGQIFLRNCVVDTQLKVCQLTTRVLGRGTCEAGKDKLGAVWTKSPDVVEIVCQSPGGFANWSKEWASIPKDRQTRTKASLDKTSCHAVLEAVNTKLVVDLTAALSRLRWMDNVPTLAP